MTPTSRNLLAAVATPVVLTLALSGCAGPNHTGNHGQSSADNSVHEGAHGPDTDTGTGVRGLSDPLASADWNAVDASYLSQMIGHHHQALEMAALATSRAVDPRVRSIAATIDASQGREIIVMATWLVDHGLPEPTLDDVDHQAGMAGLAGMAGGMPGMLSATQMTDLAVADGASFDRLFLEGMIQHHQGAVGMAEKLLGAGKDQRVNEMATEVIAVQNGEINRMRDLLLTLT